jgi:lysophospholipid acyltransferase
LFLCFCLFFFFSFLLQYYVYWRLPLGPVRTYGTYFVSAFWHGFYPGYYMFFLYAALLTETGRVARRVLRPLFVRAEEKKKNGAEGKETPLLLKPLYDALGVFCTMTFTNFGGVGFVLLSFQDTWRGWRALHFYGLVGVPLFFAYLSFVHPLLFRTKRQEK